MSANKSQNTAQGELYPDISLSEVYTGITPARAGKTVYYSSDRAEFRRPVKTMVIRPVLGAMTANARKLFIAMLSLSHRQIKDHQTRGTEMLSTDFFSSDYLDMVAMITNSEGRQAEVLKKSISALQSIVIDVTAPEDGELWNRMPLVGQAKLIRKNGGRVLQWSLAPDMVAILKDSGIFQSYNIRNIAKLSSYSALSLYDICVRYVNIGKTCINDTQWWMSALMTECKAQSKKKKNEPKTLEWRKFKHRFVKKAIDEINENTDITIELIESKTRLEITDIQFNVKQKPTERANTIKLIPKVMHSTLAMAKSMDIPEKYIHAQYKKGYGNQEIELALAKLNSRLQDKSKGPVTNIGAYMASIFKEIPLPSIEKGGSILDCDRVQTPLSPAELMTIPSVKQSIEVELDFIEKKLTDYQKVELLKNLKEILIMKDLYKGSIKEQFDNGIFKGVVKHFLKEAYINLDYDDRKN